MSTEPESFAVADARQSFLEVPPSLSLTVAGQVFTNQKPKTLLSFSRIEVLEPYELKFVAELAAHTWVMFLKMPRKLLPGIAIALTL
jgi:hypothetical protein